MMRDLEKLKSGDVVGIDREGVFNGINLALIQIATANRAYLIRCFNKKKIPDSKWEALENAIFLRNDIWKIGFGFNDDLKIIGAGESKVMKNFFNSPEHRSSFIDLKDSFDDCQNQGLITFDYYDSEVFTVSLTNLYRKLPDSLLTKSAKF